MRTLMIVCLMAGTGNLFAQNLQMSDFSQLLSLKTTAELSHLLEPKGFKNSKSGLTIVASSHMLTKIDSWHFNADTKPESSAVSVLHRWTDSSGKAERIIFETANPFFYMALLNQFSASGFTYRETISENNQVALSFSNGREDIQIKISSIFTVRNFSFSIFPSKKKLKG